MPAAAAPDYAAMSQQQLIEQLEQLQAALDKERKVSSAYADELKRTKEANLAMQSQVEAEEEAITNKLMKRLEQLKREKQALANEVEVEEEFLTNTLQKKLEKLNREKMELEQRLEAEQEYVVNKLTKQLDQLKHDKGKLHKEKVDLENQLEAEQEYIMNKLQQQLDKLGGEKAALQRERTDLQRQCGELAGAVDKLNRDKVLLEAQMEAEEESIVNRLQRQLEALTSSYRALEGRLEARGLGLRELGLAPSELPPEAWASYSRSSSRASSGELSRQSWGSSRGLAIGGPGSGHHGHAFGPASSGMQSPSGSLGRSSGDLMGHGGGGGGHMGPLGGSKCGGSGLHHSSSSGSRPRSAQLQRPISATHAASGASPTAAAAAAAAGAAGAAAAAGGTTAGRPSGHLATQSQ